jgi:molybdenum cofactor cytidylyltransferase
MKRVGAIILAAGKSTRMGRNKMLEPIGGKPMLLHCVESVVSAKLHGHIIAVGHQREAVRLVLKSYEDEIIYVDDYENGIAHSLSGALRAAPDDWDSVLICLGDMPFVKPALLKAMAEKASSDRIIVPYFHEKRGNPIAWGRNFFPDLLALEGDEGGRRLLEQHKAHIDRFPADDDAIHADIDCEMDFAKRVKSERGSGMSFPG